MKRSGIVRTAIVLIACTLCGVSSLHAQSLSPFYDCMADSMETFGQELVCLSMKDYEGKAVGKEGEEYSCKLSLSWFGLPTLGGVPFYMLQFDIRPYKGLEFVASKRSHRALLSFADNGMGVYDIGNAHCRVYPEGICLQYLVNENTDCMELFTSKNITDITFTDSLYHSLEKLTFKDFRSASTLAFMQEAFKVAANFLPPDASKAPLIGRPTENAKYPGGYYAFERFVGKNLVYPYWIAKLGIEGVVGISFIVNEDGSLSDFKVVTSVDPRLDAEALRVARLMPNWKPAKFYGKPVKTLNSVSFPFYRWSWGY